MSYLLSSTAIKAPNTMRETNSTQFAEQRTLGGDVTRDHFGTNKRIWELEYENCNKTDFDTINAIYQSYIATTTEKTWQITETNYQVAATTVHVDLQVRNFNVKGENYISDFTLILKET